jgi:hypothetical protein
MSDGNTEALMAKKAQGKTTKTATKAAKKNTMTAAKKDGAMAKTAKRVGRTLGRAAGKMDKLAAVVKKSVSGKRGTKKPKVDPELAATKARNRALWKSQAAEATSVELAKQGTLVDERARARSLTGMSWSNRKPR